MGGRLPRVHNYGMILTGGCCGAGQTPDDMAAVWAAMSWTVGRSGGNPHEV